MIVKKIVHPFLLAIFPVLFLFAYNIDEARYSDLLWPIPIVLVGTLILLFLLRLVTKSYVKGAIAASYFLLLFFSYGHVRDAIYSLLRPLGVDINWIGPTVNTSLWVLWTLLLFIGVLLIGKAQRNFSTLTKFLNITAVILVSVSLVNIGIYEVKTGNLELEKMEEGSATYSKRPDIYYIILDCHSRQDVLMEHWNYDNGEFINFLTDRGFYVASESYSNYPRTLLSVSSSLNMQYTHYVLEEGLSDLEAKTILFRMVQDNEVSRVLKSIGYHYVYVSSGWAEGGMHRYADMYRTISKARVTNFAARLIRTTVIAPLVFSLTAPTLRDRVLYAFDTLSDLPAHRNPLFVFGHVQCPHAPYIFDRYGNPTAGGEGTYIEQLRFVDRMAKVVVDELLESDEPPIIILQGDTGEPGMDILNAYYLPGVEHDLYPTISPINSFRKIFNLYFGGNYELLEDESHDIKL